MKLYNVTITLNFVVVGESETDAELRALTSLDKDEHGVDVTEVEVDQIRSKKDLPKDWDTMTLPFGATNNKPIGKYL